MPEPRTDATAIALGDTVYVFGGTGLAGPTTTIYRLKLTKGLPTVQDDGTILGWASAPDLAAAAGATRECDELQRQRLALRHRWGGRRRCSAGHDLLGGPGRDHRGPARLEPSRPDAAAGGPRLVGHRRHRLVRVRHRRPRNRRRARLDGPLEHLATAAVLPAGHPGCDHPGALHQGRDRAAARLHQRHDRGHDQLRAAHPARDTRCPIGTPRCACSRSSAGARSRRPARTSTSPAPDIAAAGPAAGPRG